MRAGVPREESRGAAPLSARGSLPRQEGGRAVPPRSRPKTNAAHRRSGCLSLRRAALGPAGYGAGEGRAAAAAFVRLRIDNPRPERCAQQRGMSARGHGAPHPARRSAPP